MIKKKSLINIISILTLSLFLFPFIGLYINHHFNMSIGEIETFGLSLKDFFSIWIALFGAIAVTYNISLHQQRLKKQQKQIELQSKGERNGRFSKAIELLGNNHESARIGAVHSLFFLAHEYGEEYRAVVFDILCSHLRTTTSSSNYKERFTTEPSNEVKTIIDIIFTNYNNKASVFEDLEANLSGCFLRGLILNNAKITNATFSDTCFDNTTFYNVDFTESKFIKSSFRDSKIHDCIFQSTIFFSTKFLNSTINRINFEDSFMNTTTFESCDLYSAHFEGSNLINMLFCLSQINECSFSGTKIHPNSLFVCSDIYSSDFYGAYIEYSFFFDSIIDNSIFDCAYIYRTNFKSCSISNSTIHGGGHYNLSIEDVNRFSGNRTLLLKKQINKDSTIHDIKFGKHNQNYKEKIFERLVKLKCLPETITEVREKFISRNFHSQEDDFKTGKPNISNINNIIEKLNKIEIKCNGWRQNRKSPTPPH